MIYEDADRPFVHHHVTRKSDGSPRRPATEPVPIDGRMMAPPSAVAAEGRERVWGGSRGPRAIRIGGHNGFQTGIELLDAPFGGFRGGASHVIQSPGGEALEAGRRLVAAAREAGTHGVLLDPETVIRHAVPERVDPEAPWRVERPHTIPALCRYEPPTGEKTRRRVRGAAPSLVVLALPPRLVSTASRQEQVRFVRWCERLTDAARAAGSIVVLLLPWCGASLPRALETVVRRATANARYERTVDGGIVVRNLRDGRVRAHDAEGRPDRRRERRLHEVLLPWGAAPAS